jgi:putative membrane protein
MTDRALARVPVAIRGIAGAAGLLVVAYGAWGLRAPLASMASYTAALMALNQMAPPLLLLALPSGALGRCSVVLAYVFDPWAAGLMFVSVSIAISLPGVFDPALANAVYAAPLGALELLSGLLFWAQLIPATRSIGPDWLVACLAWFGAMPMTAVAIVWMLSPDVLYTPYLDVICRWNIPPLADQRWAGLVMFGAGLPLPLAGAWILLGLSSAGRP